MAMIEQAVFTSAPTHRATGYQLIGRSPGLAEDDARELAVWGPSHDSLLDLGPDAVVSGRAAAHLHGLDGFGEGPLEFLGPRSYRSRSTSGTLRVSGTLERKDWTVVNGLRCTSATRTVIELLATATLDEAGDALASATRMRLTAPAVVERRLTELGRSGRAGVAAFDEPLGALLGNPQGLAELNAFYDSLNRLHRLLEGDLAPSVDAPTHLYIYRQRPDVQSVVHTHSTFATAWAAA